MKRTCKLSLSFLCFLICFLLSMSGIRARDEALAADIAPKILRFHVLANSDSAKDQALKLRVKDLLLEKIRDGAAAGQIAVKSIGLKGIEGLAKIQEIMENFRKNPPKTLGGYEVTSARDYKKNTITDIATGEVKETGLPESNVLYYDMNDGAWLCIRPSGTEPKIKFYYGVKGTSLDDAEVKSKAVGDELMGMVDKMM